MWPQISYKLLYTQLTITLPQITPKIVFNINICTKNRLKYIYAKSSIHSELFWFIQNKTEI